MDRVQCTVRRHIVKLGLLWTRGSSFCVHISLHKNIRWRLRTFAFNYHWALSIGVFFSLSQAHGVVIVHRIYSNSTLNNCLRCHIKMLIYVPSFSNVTENRAKHKLHALKLFLFIGLYCDFLVRQHSAFDTLFFGIMLRMRRRKIKTTTNGISTFLKRWLLSFFVCHSTFVDIEIYAQIFKN